MSKDTHLDTKSYNRKKYEKGNGNQPTRFFKNAALAGAGLVLSSGTVLASGEDKTAFIQSPNSNLSTLPTRKLGPLEVTGIGLGCMSMVAGTYNPTPPKDEMIAHLRKAVERGRPFPCRFFRL